MLPSLPALSAKEFPPVPASPPPAQLTGRRGPLIRAGRAAVPPPPPPEAFVEGKHTSVVQGKAEVPVLMPVGGRAALDTRARPEERSGIAPVPPVPKPERTDPRIVYSGSVNRKVLDALKKVKRVESAAPVSAPKEEAAPLPIADVLARDTLQVALRMEQGGRLDEAIRFLERSIAQSPEAASLYNRLAIILMRERGDYRRAETLIRKAIELAPENNVYGANLQQVLSRHAVRAHR